MFSAGSKLGYRAVLLPKMIDTASGDVYINHHLKRLEMHKFKIENRFFIHPQKLVVDLYPSIRGFFLALQPLNMEQS